MKTMQSSRLSLVDIGLPVQVQLGTCKYAFEVDIHGRHNRGSVQSPVVERALPDHHYRLGAIAPRPPIDRLF